MVLCVRACVFVLQKQMCYSTSLLVFGYFLKLPNNAFSLIIALEEILNWLQVVTFYFKILTLTIF